MSDTKFTPGPWSRGYGNSVWREPFKDAKGRRVHQPICDADAPAALSDEEKEANANLIAAAPDLYEALVNIRKELQLSGNWEARDYGWQANRQAIEAALAKAQGRQA